MTGLYPWLGYQGVGLVVSDAGSGLAVDVRVRTLLVHQDKDFSDSIPAVFGCNGWTHRASIAPGTAPRQGPQRRLLPHRGQVRALRGRQWAVPARRPVRRAALGATARHPGPVPGARARQLRSCLARRGPRAGARQPQARPRRRRPAGRKAARRGHAVVRGGVREGGRDPQRRVEGRGQVGEAVAGEPQRVRLPAHRRQGRRPGDDGRCHGGGAAHLDEQARDRTARPLAHQRDHEVGHRAGLPERQPGRRGHRGGAAETPGEGAPHAGAGRCSPKGESRS